MPFSNPKQPAAVFFSIKRKQGLAAAKAFGAKHRESMASAAKADLKAKGTKPYQARSKRSK